MRLFKSICVALTVSALAGPFAHAEGDEFENFCVARATELENPAPQTFCSCLAEKAQENDVIEKDLRETSEAASPEDVMASVSESTAAAIQACGA